MNNSTKPRKCAGGCGRTVAPPARKCSACRKQAARAARQRRSSGGGWHHGGAAARVLSYSSPLGPINPSAAAYAQQPGAECRFCGFPVSRCYCPGRRAQRQAVPLETDHDAKIDALLNRADALADLANEFDTLATRQEIFGAAHPESSPLSSPYADALSDVQERIETHLQEATP